MATEVTQYSAIGAKQETDEPVTSSAMAIHAEDGENHVVGIGNIRVILCNENGFWFAQGVDIDYAADGRSPGEAKKNFEDGLKATLGHHLQFFKSIEKLLVSTPHEVWREMLVSGGKRMRFSQVTHHEIFDPSLESMPYSGIDYYQPEDSVAA